MPDYDNTNRGAMFKNDDKQEDNHPDFNGSINVEGVDYWLSGWIKEGKEGGKMAGRKFFSLSVKPKETRRAAPAKQGKRNDIDDDIPF